MFLRYLGMQLSCNVAATHQRSIGSMVSLSVVLPVLLGLDQGLVA